MGRSSDDHDDDHENHEGDGGHCEQENVRNDENSGGSSDHGRGSIRNINVVEEREEDYVYDVYCLKQTTPDDSEKEIESRVDDESMTKKKNGGSGSLTSSGSWGDQNQTHNDNRDGFERDERFEFDTVDDCSTNSCSDPVMVQMRGGYGFWNEHGELVLEAAPTGQETCSEIDDNDDDYDSNCEEYDGNDYPDDDENEEDGIFIRGANDEYDSDDDIEYSSIDFRNRAIDLGTNINYSMQHYGDDDDDIGDGEYSGYMNDSSRWSRERIYGETEAYDPYYDEE